MQSTSATSGMGQQVWTTAGNLVEVCDCLCFALSATTTSSITRIAMLRMQAAIVCSNLICYILLPMAFADLANSMRKAILVWSAQAGFDLVALEIRMWELLPASLLIATISALVIEV